MNEKSVQLFCSTMATYLVPCCPLDTVFD